MTLFWQLLLVIVSPKSAGWIANCLPKERGNSRKMVIWQAVCGAYRRLLVYTSIRGNVGNLRFPSFCEYGVNRLRQQGLHRSPFLGGNNFQSRLYLRSKMSADEHTAGARRFRRSLCGLKISRRSQWTGNGVMLLEALG